MKPATKLQPIENIQFIDLAAQQARIKTQIEAGIARVLSHGKYIMGPEVKQLEDDLSAFCGAKYSISCSNGTDALKMALMALGVKPGDAVFAPSFTFAATAEVIALIGATPVFVDVDHNDYNISLESLQDAYKSIKDSNLNPVGIIPVDLFGLPADYDELESFAKDNDLWILADAAQGFGSEYKGKKAGNFGIITTTSFFPAKPLGCYGDGGAIFTDNDEIADTIKSIRVHGKGTDKYDNARIGLNGRLDTLQAAILIEKLKIFGDEISKRNEIAKRYNEGLKDVIQTPVMPDNKLCAWAQYTLQCEKADQRSKIQDFLKEYGVPTAVYYPLPLHQQTAYKHYPSASDMSVSEDLALKVFSLPMHPYLDVETQDFIIQTVKQALA